MEIPKIVEEYFSSYLSGYEYVIAQLGVFRGRKLYYAVFPEDVCLGYPEVVGVGKSNKLKVYQGEDALALLSNHDFYRS